MTEQDVLIYAWLMAENSDGSRIAQQQALDQIQRLIESAIPDIQDYVTTEDDSSEIDDAEPNPFFGLFGGSKPKAPQRGSGRSGKSAPAKVEKSFDIAFTDACDNVREFTIEAFNKQHALAKAKQYMAEDGEKLKGAKFRVALA